MDKFEAMYPELKRAGLKFEFENIGDVDAWVRVFDDVPDDVETKWAALWAETKRAETKKWAETKSAWVRVFNEKLAEEKPAEEISISNR